MFSFYKDSRGGLVHSASHKEIHPVNKPRLNCEPMELVYDAEELEEAPGAAVTCILCLWREATG